MVNTILTGWKEKLSESLVKRFGLQTAIDKVPNELINTIQPVFNVEEERDVEVVNATATGTIFTTDTKKKTYIIALSIAAAGDGAPALSSIAGTLKSGATKNLLGMSASGGVSLSFSHPIELQKGTNVTFTSSGATDNCTVYYYEVD